MKKTKLRIGSWNVCGLATEERKNRLKIVEQIRRRDLDIVGNDESWEKKGGGEDAKLESTHGYGRSGRDSIARMEGWGE